ncbi:TPA: hypothetical protein L5U90_003231 [Pseudomonas aeruginosa]|nr:hypothetical protein [Pseudomonas aeruginosa]
MSELRLNLGILFVMIAGACAGFSWIEGTAGFESDFAKTNHEYLMLAFPTAAAIFGMLGGFLIGTASVLPRKAQLDHINSQEPLA